MRVLHNPELLVRTSLLAKRLAGKSRCAIVPLNSKGTNCLAWFVL